MTRLFTRYPRLFCFLLGALMALTFAPFYWWPILFLSLPVFFLLLDAATGLKQAALRGFFFGYGYWIGGTWWIANALTVDLAKFGWLIPFCVLGLSAVMALYFGFFGWMYARFTASLRRSIATAAIHLQDVEEKMECHVGLWPPRDDGMIILRLICFVLLWVAVEYLRSLGMFGFPWNVMGYAALASLEVAQLASVIGVYGLSLLVVTVGLLPILLVGSGKRRRLAGGVLPLLILAGSYGYGAARIPVHMAFGQTRVNLVQPSIPQEVKGGDAWAAVSAEVLNALMRQAPAADVTVWPETAYPVPVRGNRIAPLPPAMGTLITGALRIEGQGETNRIYNGIVAANSDGLLLAAYDKHQLVPFGEFVPLRAVLPLEKITPGAWDFTRGGGPQTVLLRDLPAFSPLVCYEVVFPWMAVDKNHRPSWIVNVTNDAWYGDSPGPYQHLAAARMRAIEQGLPLVRAANNGISAVVDPYGRLATRQGINERSVIQTRLPEAIPRTLYATYGEWPMLLLLTLTGGLLYRCRSRKY